MRDKIAQNFSYVLCTCLIIGLFMPYLETLPRATGITLISIAIFFSCSKVSVAELKQISIKHILPFYLLRFMAIPVALFYLAKMIIPEYAIGVLLVSLAPVGVSSTVVAIISRANPTLTLSATVVTNALAPFVIPFFILFVGKAEVEIDTASMLKTLMLAVFVPSLLYFCVVRRVSRAKAAVQHNAGWVATLCVGGMMAYVTSLEKHHILNNIPSVLALGCAGLCIFAVFFGVARLYAAKMPMREVKSYMLVSGINNTGLAAGVAALYFSPATILFCVLVEFPWLLSIVLYKKWAARRD